MADLIPMSAKEFSDALLVLGFKGAHYRDNGTGAFARWRGSDSTTISAYRSGRVPIPADLARLLRLMVKTRISPSEVDSLPTVPFPSPAAERPAQELTRG